MDEESIKIVKNFKKKIPFACKVILFGSRARGDFLKGSDYDIIIISDSFHSIPFIYRPAEILHLWDADEDAEIFCYTNDEISRLSKQIGTISTGMKEGVEI